jgi:hypothetical protein
VSRKYISRENPKCDAVTLRLALMFV